MHQISPYTLKVDWSTFYVNPNFCHAQFNLFDIGIGTHQKQKSKFITRKETTRWTDRTKPNTRNGVEIIWSLRTSPGNDGQTETIFWG